MQCTTLDQLWDNVSEVNKKHFPDNKLMPIFGGGRKNRPKIMFIFINPTAKNQSSSPEWKGLRFPFVGTKNIWKVFNKSGFLDSNLLQKIENSKEWSVELTNEVHDFLDRSKIYFTNIVKWTGHDATLPDSKKIKIFLPILHNEIEIVKPNYIVAFGLIPFEHISGEKIKLDDYYQNVNKSGKIKCYEMQFGSVKTKVIPCYFPVGLGNPKRAVELLKIIRREFHE